MEPVNESRCLNEMAAAAGFSGIVIVREGRAGWLGWATVVRERRRAIEGKNDDECDSDL